MKQSISVLFVLILLNLLVFAVGQPVFAAAKQENQLSESTIHKTVSSQTTEIRY